MNRLSGNITTKPTPVSDNIEPRIWGIEIDENDSNPSTCITPTDDLANNHIPDFGEKPCIFRDRRVEYYLDPNDFTKRDDGTDVLFDVASGSAGDVMIEVPKMGYYINRINDKIIIKLTNHPNPSSVDPKFRTYAHTRYQEGDRDYIYYGAYLGHTVNGKLRSLPWRTPISCKTIGELRSYAEANGDGYQQLS